MSLWAETWCGVTFSGSKHRRESSLLAPSPRHLVLRHSSVALLYTLVHTSETSGLSIAEFRRQCLSRLENLPDEGIVINKHRQTLARAAPWSLSWRF